MMRSRNKDNKNVPNFKERNKFYFTEKDNFKAILKDFYDFAAAGVPGEMTRLYRGLNARDMDKVREALVIKLIKDKSNLVDIDKIVASVAQQKENRAENKWLFDFDIDSKYAVEEFLKDIEEYTKDYFCTKTPNGYAVVVNTGFDTRKILEKWSPEVSLHKDDYLFITCFTNE